MRSSQCLRRFRFSQSPVPRTRRTRKVSSRCKHTEKRARESGWCGDVAYARWHARACVRSSSALTIGQPSAAEAGAD
eukprot:2272187-Prymnesium_polylepis.1